MRRALLACFVVLAGLTAVPSASAATKTVSGDVLGSDFRAVDVFIGIDLQDASGRHLTSDGSPSAGGYSITMRINQDLGAEGSPDRAAWKTGWSATVPSNTAKMFVEVYPRNAGQYGTTNDVRYGRNMRRFSVPGSLTNVHLRLPLQCAKGGGTGSITGYTTVGGVRKQVYRVSAFSIGADNNAMNPILGFNIGTSASNGSFRVPSLAPGTKYRLFAVKAQGGTQKSTDVTVGRCASTSASIAF
ncbi:MAG: hypothetical protein JWN77_2135 [Frankiales bacterium]|jgi:hypothetical protein|nr:hypothetical protein [Frankiales bacterium]